MKVLVACVFSGIVRDAFKEKGREQRLHRLPPSKNIWRERIAKAMADQWGNL